MDWRRLARGLVVLGVIVGVLLGCCECCRFLGLIVYTLPATAALMVLEDPLGSDVAAAIFFAMLALETLGIAWWIGGGRGWRGLARRALATALALYGSTLLYLFLLLMEAAAGMGGPGW
ncbi:MAG: hypothetical protein GSR80_000111 [Desulfurococcales archaeon]|nr:hypothetical protein [Desulfurococcales archaeon]